MPDTRDPQAVIAAAEQAALAGDYAAAERLLREAAELQEATLGPLHPELANTLNNLGVVYEVTEKPDEAERSFRRAFEIAAAVLSPDHPFVATSRKNLEDFAPRAGSRSMHPHRQRRSNRKRSSGRRSNPRRRRSRHRPSSLRRRFSRRKPLRRLLSLHDHLARWWCRDSSPRH